MSFDRKVAIFVILALILPLNLPLFIQYPGNLGRNFDWNDSVPISQNAANESLVPLRRAIFVESDSDSYIDDFAYMAAVPMSIFYDSGTKYVSPLLYTDEGTSSDNLIDDWVEYIDPDGGITQAISIGNVAAPRISNLQRQIGSKIYPQITGQSSHEIAATIAANDWRTSDIAVMALARDEFDDPATQSGSSSYVFENVQLQNENIERTLPAEGTLTVEFEPPSDAGWIYGVVNWTTSDPLLHQLKDPAGRIVDYSVYSQAFPKRSTTYVDNLVPTHFWLPNTIDGTWELTIEPGGVLTSDLDIEISINYYPGYRQDISIPANANWLNITANWNNAGTILNIALIDSTGRMVQWEPSESLLSGAGGKHLEMPYPMQGEWTLLCSWMDPSTETNALDIEWDISTLSNNLGGYLESASNGAVLASLLNAPLLYANSDSLPTISEWALMQLDVSNVILVDPAGLQSGSLATEINDHAMLTNLNTYPATSDMISTISDTKGVVITLPHGTGNEVFPAAALSAAFHGSPIFSLSGNDNSMTTRAEETWAPYMIGPNIDIFVTNQYDTRAENGWYDERIPNIYSMYHSADSFEAFLTQRGAYNSSEKQPITIVSGTSMLKTSFDRSLQSHFIPGRIPAVTPQDAAFMINKATLHSFIFRNAESADTTLLSMYAYTDGAFYTDNYGNSMEIRQYDEIESDLTSSGFQIEPHVGVDEVYSTLNSQVSLWSFSTHGTLTRYPEDPPNRPNGPGVFSLRDEDAPYGFEVSVSETTTDDDLVNPVIYSPESSHHIIRTTDDLSASVGYLGSPIITVTACLLGGSEFPQAMMERGAVAVVAAPRTVYFRAAGILTIYFMRALTDGNSTGASLNHALRAISYDYTNIQSYTPTDYANQQILFGDPSIKLLNPNTIDRIVSVNPDASFNQHTPNNGVSTVAALGTTEYLPGVMQTLSVDYDFYTPSNISLTLNIFELFNTVILEPSTMYDLNDFFSSHPDLINNYVSNGGTLVVLGFDEQYTWMPGDVSYNANDSGTEVEITDTGHPLVNIPNEIGSNIEYSGTFVDFSRNLSILATDGTNPVLIAGLSGMGKMALSTITDPGLSGNAMIENAISWASQPSIFVGSLSKNQEVIWSGDRVIIEIELIDAVGNPVIGAQVQSWINSTSVPITETGNGFYSIILSETWTSNRTGIFDIHLRALSDGMDTLDLTIRDFLFIRPSPLPIVIAFGAVIAVVGAIWIYRKRKQGEPVFERQKDSGVWSKLSPEAKERFRKEEEERKRRQKEDDEKFDPKEIFGV